MSYGRPEDEELTRRTERDKKASCARRDCGTMHASDDDARRRNNKLERIERQLYHLIGQVRELKKT